MKRFQSILVLLLLLPFAIHADEPMMDANGNPMKIFTKADKIPVSKFKVRLLPIMGAVGTSVTSNHFDHSVGFDYEKFMGGGESIGIAVLHSHLTLGVSDKNAAGITDYTFYEELQIGGYYTMYSSPFFLKPRTYTRLGAYVVIPSQSTPAFNPGDTKRFTNYAISGLGGRAFIEFGYSTRMGEATDLELAFGLSGYFSNPYNYQTHAGNIPADYLHGSAFGVADVCPSLMMNLGFNTF